MLTDEQAAALCEALPDGYQALGFLDEKTILILDAMRYIEPELIPLVARLSHAGSHQARERAVKCFGGIISMVGNNAEVKSNPTVQNTQAVFRDVSSMYAGSLCWLVQFAWSFTDVAHDAGITDHDTLMDHENRVIRNHKPNHHDWYWRGVSALSFATDFFLEKYRPEEHEEFIEWAGNHPDIGSVINFAIERKTKDISTLEELLEQSTLAPALGRGTL